MHEYCAVFLTYEVCSFHWLFIGVSYIRVGVLVEVFQPFDRCRKTACSIHEFFDILIARKAE
jgi:hypothetical protein